MPKEEASKSINTDTLEHSASRRVNRHLSWVTARVILQCGSPARLIKGFECLLDIWTDSPLFLCKLELWGKREYFKWSQDIAFVALVYGPWRWSPERRKKGSLFLNLGYHSLHSKFQKNKDSGSSSRGSSWTAFYKCPGALHVFSRGCFQSNCATNKQSQEATEYQEICVTLIISPSQQEWHKARFGDCPRLEPLPWA